MEVYFFKLKIIGFIYSTEKKIVFELHTRVSNVLETSHLIYHYHYGTFIDFSVFSDFQGT